MVYNMPETIYYKAARKLWHYARCKIFNKNILPELAKPYPDLSPGQLGYDMEESPIMEIDSSIHTVPGIENSQQDSCTGPLKLPDKEMNDFNEIELSEELTAEQILAHVKKSAKMADRLTLKRPDGSHLNFLRQKNDGTTTLGIIGSQGKEKTVTLGSLVGQLSDGISCLPPYKEPEENQVKMIGSVTITPFSSFLPSMDSTFATVTFVSKEETQLLTSTYGEDEIGLHYTQSLLSFANDND